MFSHHGIDNLAGVREYNGSGSNWASRNVLLSGPILVSKAWAIVLVAAANEGMVSSQFFAVQRDHCRCRVCCVYRRENPSWADQILGRISIGQDISYVSDVPWVCIPCNVCICSHQGEGPSWFMWCTKVARLRTDIIYCTNRVKCCERSPQGKIKAHT